MQQYKYSSIYPLKNLNNSFVTIINVSCKISSNCALIPFTSGLEFKSRHSGGLQFLGGTNATLDQYTGLYLEFIMACRECIQTKQ